VILNDKLRVEYDMSVLLQKMSGGLDELLRELAMSVVEKHNRFNNVSSKLDAVNHVMETMERLWIKFDPQQSDDIFAYYNQCVISAVLDYISKERRRINALNQAHMDALTILLAPLVECKNDHTKTITSSDAHKIIYAWDRARTIKE